MTIKIQVDTLAFTLIGSGEGFGSIVDSDVVFDDLGVPYIPGRRIKGLLREKAREIMEIFNPTMNLFSEEDFYVLFGKTGEREARIQIDNLKIVGYQEFNSWLKYSFQSNRLKYIVNKLSIMDYWTKIIYNTAVTPSGLAKKHSLRSSRVLNPDISFVGKIRLDKCSEKQIYLLSLACANLDRIGSKRNRGFGRIKCSLHSNGINLSEEAINSLVKEEYKFTNDLNLKTVESVTRISETSTADSTGWTRVPIFIEALGPILMTKTVGDRNTIASHPYIPALTLRGLFAHEYLKRMSIKNPNEDDFFRKWFLDGDIKFLSAYYMEKREGRIQSVYSPSPLALQIYKGTQESNSDVFNLFLMDSEDLDKNIKPLKSLIRVAENNIIVSEPKMKLNFHHSRDLLLQHPREGNIFHYESIEPNQHFIAYFKGEKTDIETFCSIFQREFKGRIGKSRSAQYGNCLIKIGKIEPYDESTIPFEECLFLDDNQFILNFKSPCILYNDMGLSETSSSLLETYIERELGVTSRVLKAYTELTLIENFVGVWKLKTPMEVAFSEGSSFLVEISESVESLTSKLRSIMKTGLGERTHEGFGDCDINSIGKDKYTLIKEDDEEPIVRPSEILPQNVSVLFNQLFHQELHKIIEREAFYMTKKLKRGEFPNHQVGRLEGILSRSQSRQDFSSGLDDLKSVAVQNLRSVFISEKRMSEFLREFDIVEIDKMIEKNPNLQNMSAEIGFKLNEKPENFSFYRKFLMTFFKEIRNRNKKEEPLKVRKKEKKKIRRQEERKKRKQEYRRKAGTGEEIKGRREEARPIKTSIRGKIVVEGTLRLLSPLTIGSGIGEIIDIEVCKDANNLPYIPASTIIGKLRDQFNSDVDFESISKEGINKEDFEYFWGSKQLEKYTGSDHLPSVFIVDDLELINASEIGLSHISVRDGIAINPQTGIVETGAKFEYEVVNRGKEFRFRADITLRDCFSKETFLRIVKYLINILGDGKVRLGRMTTKGFGKVLLNPVNIYLLDFKKNKDTVAWFTKDFSEIKPFEITNIPELPLKKKRVFKIEADFKLKSSLIVGSSPTHPYLPDKVHLKMNNTNVLPGTTILGAVRSRSLRILNTLLIKEGKGEDMLKPLFGWVDQTKINGDNYKSRIIGEEVVLEGFSEESQNRIKIDKFTGRTIGSALFESMPLWASPDDQQIHLSIQINDYKDWEAGLLLQIVKDLWNADLPLGGEKAIGRGILEGQYAFIETGEWRAKIRLQENDHLEITNQEQLEKIAQSFKKHIQVINSSEI